MKQSRSAGPLPVLRYAGKGGGSFDDISFSPGNGASNITLDAKITITFGSAMEMHNGDSISNSDIDDFIELRKGSSSGSLVDFSSGHQQFEEDNNDHSGRRIVKEY